MITVIDVIASCQRSEKLTSNPETEDVPAFALLLSSLYWELWLSRGIQFDHCAISSLFGYRERCFCDYGVVEKNTPEVSVK
ncbi:MAG: hypothetical protein R3B38_00555 [Patescibacteria group bacterium]